VIVDFSSNHEWNPRGTGNTVVGSTMKVGVRSSGDNTMSNQPEPEGSPTRLPHCGYFTGVVALFPGWTRGRTEEGFHALNRALTERAEIPTGVRRVE
jgi:hypothetical protein